jgi:predicted ATPase
VTASKIDVGDVPLLEVGKKMMTLYCDENGRGAPERIRFQYQGSILSQLEDHELGERMLFFRDFMRSISSLDLLSPNQMRLNYKRAENIGLGGEGLFAFIHALSHEKKDRFVAIMRRFYPALDSVSVLSKAYGWKQLVIDESFPDTGGVLKTEAHHINDGMLRLMGIVAQTLSEKRFLMFDEIENGFSPELIRELVQYLVREVEQQVLVTTHSPLVLNYLLDEEARESLFFVYKEEGRSKCVRFFDISEADERLQFMGPGEAYADTDLPRLVERLKTEERSEGEE